MDHFWYSPKRKYSESIWYSFALFSNIRYSFIGKKIVHFGALVSEDAERNNIPESCTLRKSNILLIIWMLYSWKYITWQENSGSRVININCKVTSKSLWKGVILTQTKPLVTLFMYWSLGWMMGQQSQSQGLVFID